GQTVGLLPHVFRLVGVRFLTLPALASSRSHVTYPPSKTNENRMRFQLSSWLRFLPVVLLLGMTTLALQARNWTEILPPHEDLSTFPLQVGDWHGIERELSPAELEVLGSGQFMMRDYQAPMKRPINVY